MRAGWTCRRDIWDDGATGETGRNVGTARGRICKPRVTNERLDEANVSEFESRKQPKSVVHGAIKRRQQSRRHRVSSLLRTGTAMHRIATFFDVLSEPIRIPV